MAAGNLKFEVAYGRRQTQGQRIAVAISFAKCHPYNKYYPNQMKNLDAKTFKKKKILKIFFQKSATAKLSKLERFAGSHWIRKYLNYF